MASRPDRSGHTAALFLCSASAIYFQAALIRSLNYRYYGGFASIIVGVALIGFGAAGTLLSVNRKRIDGRESSWLPVSALLSLAGIAAAISAAAYVPVNLAYLFYDGRRLLGFLLIILSIIPAFLGHGALIGLVLITETAPRGGVYAVNLFGSAFGGILALAAMGFLRPTDLPSGALVLMAAALPFAAWRQPKRIRVAAAVCCLLALAGAVFWRPPDRVDQYKDLAAMRLLEAQGDAVPAASANTPQGRLEAYRSSSFRYLPFLGMEVPTVPPPQTALYRDGSLIGAPFRLNGAGPSAQLDALLDRSLNGLAYDLVIPRRVLVIGDTGLNGVRRALAAGAAEVVLLLPDRGLERFLREELPQVSADVFGRPEVMVIVDHPRRYFRTHQGQFDVIHLASAETLAIPVPGLTALAEDSLLTVESVHSAVEALRPGGILTVTRGIQTPPRDNLRIFLTFHAAQARRSEVPAEHLLQARTYQAVVTMTTRDPPTAEVLAAFQKECRERNLDIEFRPGIGGAGPEEYLFALPGPADSHDSWYRYTARMAAGGHADELVASWIFDIRPPTDNRPYFHSWFRWSSIGTLSGLFGPYWFRRTGLGILILAATLAAVLLLSFLLIILPHITRGARIRSGFLAYFPAIGFGFLALEMTMISLTSLFLGNPQQSVPIVLASVLAFSGAGSLVQERWKVELSLKIAAALPAAALSLAALLYLKEPILDLMVRLDGLGRPLPYVAVTLFTGVPSFFMGWFFAPGLDRLGKLDPDALPVAWALNGFASVAAAPAAALISASGGFTLTAGTALAAYLFAFAVLRLYRFTNLNRLHNISTSIARSV